VLLDAAILVAVLILGWRIRNETDRRDRDARIHAALQTFGPAQAAVLADPRQLIAWYPLARAARKLQPETFAILDTATGATFPFTTEQVERAHAKVSSDWLAWEAAHDEEYRLKAAAAEQELGRAAGEAATLAKARLDRIQHEKIERYQQRYEEYVRTAKALQALLQ
jgi:hypothetical protein